MSGLFNKRQAFRCRRRHFTPFPHRACFIQVPAASAEGNSAARIDCPRLARPTPRVARHFGHGRCLAGAASIDAGADSQTGVRFDAECF